MRPAAQLGLLLQPARTPWSSCLTLHQDGRATPSTSSGRLPASSWCRSMLLCLTQLPGVWQCCLQLPRGSLRMPPTVTLEDALSKGLINAAQLDTALGALPIFVISMCCSEARIACPAGSCCGWPSGCRSGDRQATARASCPPTAASCPKAKHNRRKRPQAESATWGQLRSVEDQCCSLQCSILFAAVLSLRPH